MFIRFSSTGQHIRRQTMQQLRASSSPLHCVTSPSAIQLDLQSIRFVAFRFVSTFVARVAFSAVRWNVQLEFVEKGENVHEK